MLCYSPIRNCLFSFFLSVLWSIWEYGNVDHGSVLCPSDFWIFWINCCLTLRLSFRRCVACHEGSKWYFEELLIEGICGSSCWSDKLHNDGIYVPVIRLPLVTLRSARDRVRESISGTLTNLKEPSENSVIGPLRDVGFKSFVIYCGMGWVRIDTLQKVMFVPFYSSRR